MDGVYSESTTQANRPLYLMSPKAVCDMRWTLQLSTASGRTPPLVVEPHPQKGQEGQAANRHELE